MHGQLILVFWICVSVCVSVCVCVCVCACVCVCVCVSVLQLLSFYFGVHAYWSVHLHCVRADAPIYSAF